MRHLREFEAKKIKTLQVRELNLSLKIRWLNGIIFHHWLLSTDDNNSILLQIEHIREVDLILDRLLLSCLCFNLLIESLKLTPLLDVPEDEADGSTVQSKEQLPRFECMSVIHEKNSSTP